MSQDQRATKKLNRLEILSFNLLMQDKTKI